VKNEQIRALAQSSAQIEPRVSGWGVRREAIARQIESAALKLFAKEGVERVTVEKIAAAAQISERTFFRYFASREDVLMALPSRSLARVSAAVEARPAEEDVVTAFKAGVRGVEITAAERELTFLWGRVMLRSPEAGAASVGRLHPNTAECFQRLIAARIPKAARAAGHAEPLASAVGGIVSYAFVQWITSGGRGEPSVAIESAFDALPDLWRGPRASSENSAPGETGRRTNAKVPARQVLKTK
jgi:AcrR family transcriptional regulator